MKYLLILILFLGLIFGADHYNQGVITFSGNVDDVTKNEYESNGNVKYKWVAPAMADSTGSYHSRPIFIGDCNDNDGRVKAILADDAGETTEDVNIIFHFSNDLANWESTTAASLDQLAAATAKYSLIGYETTNDLKFHNSNWLVIEADGQAGNPIETYVTIWLEFVKDIKDMLPNGETPLVAKIRRSSVTDP